MAGLINKDADGFHKNAFCIMDTYEVIITHTKQRRGSKAIN